MSDEKKNPNKALVSFTKFSHILKKKNFPFPELRVDLSFFEYVGSLISFTEFSYILKKQNPLLNNVLT